MSRPSTTISAVSRADFAVVALLVLVVIVYVALTFNFDALPHEDAAMLMRYAVHLADGHGIRWNIDEPPIDGATDFLFMVAVAALVKTGTGVEKSVRVIGLLAHLFSVLLIYLGVRKLWGTSRWVAAACGLYIALGPGLGHVGAQFGTTFFGFFAALTWYLALRLIIAKNGRFVSGAFGFSALAMGLTRPEGVFLAVFMLLAIVYTIGWRDARRTVAHFAAVFSLFGGAYFVWRWVYFGHPLPNPFYKKGGGHLYIDGLYTSIKSTVMLSLPFLAVYLAAFRSRLTFRMALTSLIPIGGFTLIWLFLSGEMNYLRRFQYATLPIVLLSWPALTEVTRRAWNLPSPRTSSGAKRLGIVVFAALFLMGSVGYGATVWLTRKHRKFTIEDTYHDGRYDIARMLQRYAGEGYTIAVTEAGILPLYSDWRALDTWGLNDRWIAHHGMITGDYLDRYRPEVIMCHAEYRINNPPRDPGPWAQMVIRVHEYAVTHDYVPAAIYGDTPDDVHAYYVRRGFEDSEAIIQGIRDIDYSWYRSGVVCTNYEDLAGPGDDTP